MNLREEARAFCAHRCDDVKELEDLLTEVADAARAEEREACAAMLGRQGWRVGGGGDAAGGVGASETGPSHPRAWRKGDVMVRALREWWRTLGYCNGRRTDEFRTWGIRPWVGGPWFWFTIDTSETAKPVERGTWWAANTNSLTGCVDCNARHTERENVQLRADLAAAIARAERAEAERDDAERRASGRRAALSDVARLTEELSAMVEQRAAAGRMLTTALGELTQAREENARLARERDEARYSLNLERDACRRYADENARLTLELIQTRQTADFYIDEYNAADVENARLRAVVEAAVRWHEGLTDEYELDAAVSAHLAAAKGDT